MNWYEFVDLNFHSPLIGISLHSGSKLRSELEQRAKCTPQERMYEEDPRMDELARFIC